MYEPKQHDCMRVFGRFCLHSTGQSRKFTMTEMAISTPTYYTLKYLGGITHVPVLRCSNYIQVVYFFGGFAPF